MEKYNKEIVESSTNNKFLFELDQELLKGEMYKAQNDKFTTVTDVLRSVTDKHTPLKTKIIRGNWAPFITKALSKARMARSRPKSKCNKWSSRENLLAFRKAKNICSNLNKKTK